jgi:hypothetical protein
VGWERPPAVWAAAPAVSPVGVWARLVPEQVVPVRQAA